jgi:hypothetical protein
MTSNQSLILIWQTMSQAEFGRNGNPRRVAGGVIPNGPTQAKDVLHRLWRRENLGIGGLEGVTLREVDFQFIQPRRPPFRLLAGLLATPIETNGQDDIVKPEPGSLRLDGPEPGAPMRSKLNQIKVVSSVEIRQRVTDMVGMVSR